MAVTYFKVFFYVFFPVPLLLLGLLMLPLPKTLQNGIIKLCDAILFMKPHPSFKISLFWLCFLLSAVTFGLSFQAVLEKQEIYQSARKATGGSQDSKIALLGAERNLWISGCSTGLWVILYRYRSLQKRCNVAEEAQRATKKE